MAKRRWLVDKHGVVVDVETGDVIAYVVDESCRSLIAAAPDMRDALEELTFLKDVLKHNDPEEYQRRKLPAWQAAREAVAKSYTTRDQSLEARLYEALVKAWSVRPTHVSTPAEKGAWEEVEKALQAYEAKRRHGLLPEES